MSTQKYIQVEAIVAKYENLASETEAVKRLRVRSQISLYQLTFNVFLMLNSWLATFTNCLLVDKQTNML